METTFPFKPGDIFFVGGDGWLNNLINKFQAMWSSDGVTKYSHVGIITDPFGSTFETTSFLTGYQSMANVYAGSEITVLRWEKMANWRAYAGLRVVIDQEGRLYPYWRLLAHALRIHSWFHGKTMECSVLTANFLFGAGMQLNEENLWLYDVEKLYEELLTPGKGWSTIFTGSLRAAGYIK